MVQSTPYTSYHKFLTSIFRRFIIKKGASLLFIFSILLLVGCNSKAKNIESMTSREPFDIQENTSTASSKSLNEPTDSKLIEIRGVFDITFYVLLTEDESEYIFNIYNTCNWEIDITKTAYDYVIVLPDRELRYVSDVGLINDPIGNRHLYLTDGERTYINSLIGI